MKTTLFIILVLTLASCRNNQALKYFWVSYSSLNGADTIPIIGIKTDSFPSGAKTLIYYSTDTIHYFVRPDSLQGSQTNRFRDIDQTLRPLSDTIVFFNKDTFNVFKFIQIDSITDRKIIHYWESKIGIYATHTSKWLDLTILQTSDTAFNKKIKALIKETVPPYYLRDLILTGLYR